jgi:uncharacterized protein (DUF1015 family)
MAYFTNTPNGLDCAGEWLASQPDDAVDVTENGRRKWHTVIVPRFEPFNALRYSAHHVLADVTAPPYDVQSDSDRERYGLRSQYNIVHVDMPVGAEQGGARYREANRVLQDWKTNGVLVGDQSPSYTLYRMSFQDSLGRARTTVGVIGALEVVDEGSAEVLPHERTTPKAKTDRLELTRATRANLSPVWGLSLNEGLSDLLMESGDLLGSFVDEMGVRHCVERVTDSERIARIRDSVASSPVVIADGHHRYAISRTYRDEIRATSQTEHTGAELTLAYVNELVEDQLSVAAIHRLYREVPLDSLLQMLARSFTVEACGALDATVLASMETRGSLCVVHPDGTGSWLTPIPEKFVGIRDLDSARLEHALEGLAHVVEYQHGYDEVTRAVGADKNCAGILIRPVSVAEIRRTAHEGLLMPPKSTFFTPKLQTGLVIRELD